MTITIFNLIGIVLLILIVAIGSLIKSRTGSKVRDLDGFSGTVKKKNEYKKGKIRNIL
jgi:uncharacterized protein YxeA